MDMSRTVLCWILPTHQCSRNTQYSKAEQYQLEKGSMFEISPCRKLSGETVLEVTSFCPISLSNDFLRNLTCSRSLVILRVKGTPSQYDFFEERIQMGSVTKAFASAQLLLIYCGHRLLNSMMSSLASEKLLISFCSKIMMGWAFIRNASLSKAVKALCLHRREEPVFLSHAEWKVIFREDLQRHRHILCLIKRKQLTSCHCSKTLHLINAFESNQSGALPTSLTIRMGKYYLILRSRACKYTKRLIQMCFIT